MMFGFALGGPSGPELPDHITPEVMEEWSRTVAEPLKDDMFGGCAPVDLTMEQMIRLVHMVGPDVSAEMVAELSGQVCDGCFAQVKAAHRIVTSALALIYPEGQESAVVRGARAILDGDAS